MAIKFGPSTSGSDGLLFSFDAGNKRSFYNVENLISGASTFTAWSPNATPTIVLNAGTAPDGSNTANRFTLTAESSGYYNFWTAVANRTYTFSVYIKPLSGTGSIRFGSDSIPVMVNYNLATRAVSTNAGTPLNATVTSIGNGWDRISFRFVPTSAGTSSTIFYANASTNASFLEWGYKLELGEGPTDYIYTSDNIVRSTAAIDALGNQMRGTLVNGTTYSNNNGGTLLFDGVDDYMSFNINPPFRNAATIELWCKSNNSNNTWILGREGNYRMTFTSNSLNTIYSTVNNGWYTTGTPIDVATFAPTNWNHIAMTYDGSFNRLYVNSSLVATGSAEISGLVKTDGGAFEFAKPNAAGFGYFAGYLGPLNIYNKALSATEVASNFNNLRGRFGI
jgi:hypothetical protein